MNAYTKSDEKKLPAQGPGRTVDSAEQRSVPRIGNESARGTVQRELGESLNRSERVEWQLQLGKALNQPVGSAGMGTLLPSMSGKADRVAQRKDKYHPDTGEPHIHEHKGGITFTDVGHSHKYLKRGDIVYQNVVDAVIADLTLRNDARSLVILGWINTNI